MRSLLIALVIALPFVSPALAAKCTLKQDITKADSRKGLCGFAPENRSFAGNAVQQAKCLTREVKRGAAIGSPTLTRFMETLVGEPTGISTDQLNSYVEKQNVRSADLGGAFEKKITANYLIIHDTSWPNCSDKDAGKKSCPVFGELPANRDNENWRDNITFQNHPQPAPHRLAHAFTNRIGGSITEVDFATHH